MYGIAEESPEGFTAAKVPCDLELSDFISAGIHFEAERFSVEFLSDVLAGVLYRRNWITIFDVDVGVEYFKKKSL